MIGTKKPEPMTAFSSAAATLRCRSAYQGNRALPTELHQQNLSIALLFSLPPRMQRESTKSEGADQNQSDKPNLLVAQGEPRHSSNHNVGSKSDNETIHPENLKTGAQGRIPTSVRLFLKGAALRGLPSPASRAHSARVLGSRFEPSKTGAQGRIRTSVAPRSDRFTVCCL